ncbi:hypothetical protein [Mycolicibacterium chlorophenolicum]|uniref:Uncharacterized protein n=1 Tax=Mycolicibacterium chlorophenolicum TaxID=37916 RepID=A0A0J6WKR4_9MYCO|nr:hypothetical protein [Mycolicibacterium chlorophenolicum]KMO82302.1 hypothetical protein MCHLDSM_01454 [Mycolicibacterium chlorophenolicum]
MSAQSGVIRASAAVILTGPALRFALDCALIALRQRKRSGLPFSTEPYEALACELAAAMAADGHSDVHSTPVRDAVAVEKPTVPIPEVAERLDVSPRQARRLAPQLGGQQIGGRWFVDEIALREHIGGRQ